MWFAKTNFHFSDHDWNPYQNIKHLVLSKGKKNNKMTIRHTILFMNPGVQQTRNSFLFNHFILYLVKTRMKTSKTQVFLLHSFRQNRDIQRFQQIEYTWNGPSHSLSSKTEKLKLPWITKTSHETECARLNRSEETRLNSSH